LLISWKKADKIAQECSMNESDLKRLEEAVKLLENPGWIAKITQMIGMPIDWAIKKLPEGAGSADNKSNRKSGDQGSRSRRIDYGSEIPG